MNIEIFDLECFPNFFSYTGMNRDTLEIKQFYIYDEYKQLTDILDHIKSLDGMIGFNNINFDYPLLHFILKNANDWSIYEIPTILNFIYEESNKIIKTEFSSVPHWQVIIPQLDLFKIWHFDNKSRMTSLKQIEIALNFENVQDMPFDSDYFVRKEDIQAILDYNLNDVRATKLFYDITDKRGMIQLRKDISKKYKINCLNYSDVKIGDTINKSVYMKLTKKSFHEFKDSRTYRPNIKLKDCIPDYIEFKSDKLKDFLQKLKKEKVNQTKGEINYNISYNDTIYTIAQGGIHSNDPPRWLKSDNNYQLIDADVSSFYPATILNLKLYPAHLGIEWLEGYRETFNTRLHAKKEGNKSIAEALKLALNGGGYGKTNESYSWQYDPLVMLKVTLTGQLSLLMLIESLEDNGIKVISANTDGIISKVPTDKSNLYSNLCRDWELKTNYQLEFTYYKQIVQTSVNDYIAEKLDGSTKKKGDFKHDTIEPYENTSMKIRAIALENYFIHNIPVKETIENHTNIYDFCKSFRTSKGWKVYEYTTDGYNLIKKPLQKNIRYYISNNGAKLTKINIKDNRKIDVEASAGVTVFNTYIPKDIKDYNINYKYYISETNKIIYSINDGQLKLF